MNVGALQPRIVEYRPKTRIGNRRCHVVIGGRIIRKFVSEKNSILQQRRTGREMNIAEISFVLKRVADLGPLRRIFFLTRTESIQMSLRARPMRPYSYVFWKENFRTAVALGSIGHNPIRHKKDESRVAVFRIDCDRYARRITNRKPLCAAKHRDGGACA